MRAFVFRCLVSLTGFLVPSVVAAQPNGSFRHILREDISASEKAANFGFVYLAQWAVYVGTQHETIREHGSFENFRNNFFSPHFDRDRYEFNIVKHALAGQYYYLFYRSRGYGEVSAFWWTAVSSLAFEFAVESTTERPSYQDIFQTPAFGATLGVGTEKLSLHFHSLGGSARFLGYLFNPFTILPSSQYDLTIRPAFSRREWGVLVSLHF